MNRKLKTFIWRYKNDQGPERGMFIALAHDLEEARNLRRIIHHQGATELADYLETAEPALILEHVEGVAYEWREQS